MSYQSLGREAPAAARALDAVDAALRDMRALAAELRSEPVRAARGTLAGAHIRATLSRRARDATAQAAAPSRKAAANP